MPALLRHPADRRTLVWSLFLFPAPLVIAVFEPRAAVWMFPFSLYLAFCVGVLTHYQNHRGVFQHSLLNRLYSVWLSVFYGFPVFAWIPTHNQNHHRFLNGPGDHTSTDKLKGGDSFFQLLSYPTRSSAWQLPSLIQYLKGLRNRGSSSLNWCVTQCAALILWHISLLSFFLHRQGLSSGLTVYAFLVLLPALFAPWSMMVINYVQHVGCDPASKDNHSRNFVGRLENWFVFDAGLHTVHHEHPSAHFSEYQALHDARKSKIAPHLNQRNVFSFLLIHYLWGRRFVPPSVRL